MRNFLSQLPKIFKAKKKRRGRGLGSGRGAKSGRGTTRHQKARESIPLHFEGGQGRLVKKFPLLRGKGKNKSYRPKPIIIKLSWLNTLTDDTVVDRQLLEKKQIIKVGDKITPVKILKQGELKKKLIIRIPVSQSVKKIVEAAGGKVEL
jgi:large subunit ribosomal protein L15